ncbi:DUF6056 family protein [Thermoflexibacter ruber]|uniref:Glucosyl transferase GtrII n=1 Tax=Thermoflexibacter ruber TaxID=1003 RepID=A0A1I2HFQ7_9BACT|nr:DUF6056 family protein [Thermoflexibacter ruber]SFF28378.1 hypothetical protein SAMN04488541_102377 [Thermoflexibacter ruber]
MLKLIYKHSSLIFLLCMLILIIVPAMWVSIYNHPCSDDFGLNVKMQGRNIFELVYDFYLTWGGAYVGVFFQALLQPSEVIGFKIVPILIILLFIGSFYFMLHIFFGEKFSFTEKIMGALIAFCLFFLQIDAPNETIYWVMSASAYQAGYLLFILFVGLIILWLRKQYIFKSFSIHYSLLLLFAVLTTGHIANIGLITLGTCGLLIIYVFFKHRHLLFSSFILLAVALVGFGIFFFAPGNFIRGGGLSQERDLIAHLLLSAKTYFSYLTRWFANSFFVLSSFIFMLIAVQKKAMSTTNISFLILFFITLGISYSFMFLPQYTVGYIAGRHIDMAYLFFLSGWFLTLYFLVSNYHQFFSEVSDLSVAYLKIACLIGALLILFPTPASNERKLIEDIVRQTAKKYDEERNQRHLEVMQKKKQGQKYLVLKPLQHKPFMLFKQDLFPTPQHWYNQMFAHYYGLDSVRIEGVDATEVMIK